VWHSAIAGFTLGVGFLLTSVLVNNMFQQKSFALTVIDGLHWTLALVIEAVVISLLA
jgi:formate/nitrite transporter FocA (FNT family)